MSNTLDQWDSDRDREATARQLILLGALLANKKLREDYGATPGWNDRLTAACEDVCSNDPTRRSRQVLKAVLDDVGVTDWDSSQGNPLGLIREHIKADGEIGSLLTATSQATMAMMRSRRGSVSSKEEAMQRFRGVIYQTAVSEGFVTDEAWNRDSADEAAEYQQEAQGEDGGAGEAGTRNPVHLRAV